MFVFQTIRIDSSDVDKLTKVLKKYVKNKSSKYLVASEISQKANKPHFQGWISHSIKGGTTEEIVEQTAKVFNNFRTTLTNHYKTDKGREYSFKSMDKPDSYIPYIIHNDNKRPVSYIDLITNYTQDEYQELLQKYKWIEMRHHKLEGKKVVKKFSDVVYDKLVEKCVNNGVIDYANIMNIFMSYYAPTRVGCNPRRLKDILDGYTWRLEVQFPKNQRLHNRYYTEMCRLDDEMGIYKSDTFSYLKFQMDNKNAGLQSIDEAQAVCSQASDESSETEAEEESGFDC